MGPGAPIPLTFTLKKNAILSSLAVPESSYTDLSPKGSVDEAIKPLIERINALEGVVTTSSCAGRVSVFLEGRKHGEVQENKDGARNEYGDSEAQAAVPGGKGMGGRWLFVSHSPVQIPTEGQHLLSLLGLSHGQDSYGYQVDMDINHVRLARFQFEPMILHVMTASLHHAQPILAAAINAGFRESGVQSLKNLDDANAFPMIAIRSSGLALESVIGIMPDCVGDMRDQTSNGEEYLSHKGVHPLVSEDYLGLLLKLANDRFKTNAERMRRFEEDLFSRKAMLGTAPTWEDKTARQERKRAEGLKHRDEVRAGNTQRGSPDPRYGP